MGAAELMKGSVFSAAMQVCYQSHYDSVPRSNSWGTPCVPPALLSSVLTLLQSTVADGMVIKMVKMWGSYLFSNWGAELCCASSVLM